MKTLAAILIDQRRPLDPADVDFPPLGFGQVLAELLVSRICGT